MSLPLLSGHVGPGRSAGDDVVLLHAYDARNRGDLLLATESIHLLARAGVEPGHVRVVAFDPRSFPEEMATMEIPGSRLRGPSDVARLTAGAVQAWARPRHRPHSPMGQALREARMFVGIGGGYLRAPGGMPSLKTALVNLPQLAMAGCVGAPSVYLPQSVGPLRGHLGEAIRRNLGRVDFVAVRDDASFSELRSANAIRVPDLATLAIARHWALAEHRSGGGHKVVGVGRDLAHPPGYHQRLRDLSDMLDLRWAVQSRTARQDDAAFYRRSGLRVGAESPTAFADPHTGAVVSVRLHGALEAILAGVPAIHLTYERKGHGAYADLG